MMAGAFLSRLARAAVLGTAATSFAALAQNAPPPANQAAAESRTPAFASKPRWTNLTRAQQAALEPLAGEWDAMEPVRKQKWLEIANRFATMQVAEQQRMHARMRAWVKLTPQQRRLARENYARVKKIDKSERSAKWEQYQQLPEEEKKKLAEDARKRRAPGAKGAIAPSTAPAPAPAPAPQTPIPPSLIVPGTPVPPVTNAK